jgi:hypothetical protein
VSVCWWLGVWVNANFTVALASGAVIPVKTGTQTLLAYLGSRENGNDGLTAFEGPSRRRHV